MRFIIGVIASDNATSKPRKLYWSKNSRPYTPWSERKNILLAICTMDRLAEHPRSGVTTLTCTSAKLPETPSSWWMDLRQKHKSLFSVKGSNPTMKSLDPPVILKLPPSTSKVSPSSISLAIISSWFGRLTGEESDVLK